MPEVLYRKWRPQVWQEVVGQDHITLTLRNAVKSQRVAHAYLFAGPRGTGKTTTARLLAKAVNCLAEDPADRPCNSCKPCQSINAGQFLDLIEIDAASNTSVEDVRDLRERINFAPNEGRFKVYIVDEVHMLSTAAFNALLKTLEEPPGHAIFILATTEVHKIPSTVLSRCQRHEFRRLPVDTIVDYLQDRIRREAIRVDPAALVIIARQATGSMRDAISLLDQLASTGETVTAQLTSEILGTATVEAVRDLVLALAERDLGRGLSLINRALDGGSDPRQFGRQIVNHLRLLLLTRLGAQAAVEREAEQQLELSQLAQRFETAELVSAIQAFNQALMGTRATWQPGLPLELALVEAYSHAAGAPARQAPPTAPTLRSPASPAAPTPPIADRPTPAAARPERQPQAEQPPLEQPQQDSKGAPSIQAEAKAAAMEVNFQAILDHWNELLGAAHQRDPMAQALLNSSKPIGIEDGRLILGFGSDLLREKMEKGHNLSAIAAALQQVFGQPLGIRCVLAENWGEHTDAAGAALPVEEGGMVATALRDLGAQVVDVEPIQPEVDPAGDDRSADESGDDDDE